MPSAELYLWEYNFYPPSTKNVIQKVKPGKYNQQIRIHGRPAIKIKKSPNHRREGDYMNTENKPEVNANDNVNPNDNVDTNKELDWDDITWDDIKDKDDDFEDSEETSDADQHDDDSEEKKPDEAQTENDKDTGKDSDKADDDWLELKYMDDPVRKVSKEEAKSLAQKGLDYDRIREDRDSMKKDLPRYKEMEKVLDEMKGEFKSVDDLMDDTRARLLMKDDEKLSYEDAVAKAKESRNNRVAPKKEPEHSPVDEFVRRFPKVKAEEIPESVWVETQRTGDLVGAYTNYINEQRNDEIKKLRDEIETLKQNNKNSARSNGSRRTSGGSNATIEELWNDGT